MWLLAFGAIGVAERLFTRSYKWIRAACDSSYWVYLVHLPICMAIAILLRSWDVAAMVKMSAVIVLTYFVCVASYAGARAVVAR